MAQPGRPRFTSLQRERILRRGLESALEETELGPLLSKVVDSACELLGADDGGVGLVEDNPRRMVMAAVHNLPESEVGSVWAEGEGIAGRVLAAGKPVLINRYGDIDPQNRSELAENAVLGVPIMRRKRMVGFFGIGALPPRKFTLADQKTLSQFARACAAAIENSLLLKSIRDNLDETNLVYETTMRLSRARGLEEVVAAYLEHIAANSDYATSVVLYETDDEGKKVNNLTIGSWRPGGSIDTATVRHKHEPDSLDDGLEGGQPFFFTDVRKDPRVPKALKDIQVRDRRLSLALIPLLSRGRRIGLVALSLPGPHEWSAQDLHPFLLTSAHLAAAIDIRVEQERLAEERSSFALAEDRKRLARDLHDSVTQTLFGIQLFAQSLVDDVGPEHAEKVQNLSDLSKAGLKEMRALLAELRPVDSPFLVTDRRLGGLEAKIIKHAQGLGLAARLEIDDKRRAAASPEVEHTLYRIAQEAVTNAHKYAGASKVQIVAECDGRTVMLRIADDGQGMKANEGGLGMSLGIIGMRERAVALGGSLEVSSKPGKGVVVEARIPVSE